MTSLVEGGSVRNFPLDIGSGEVKLVDGWSEEMAGGCGEVKLVDRQSEVMAGGSG